MQASIINNKNQTEYFFEEGCFITELSNSDKDSGVSIARARVEPGELTAWHALRDTTERYVIISGHGTVGVGDINKVVTEGDVVIIPANIPQRISCDSKEDLIFLAICTPPFCIENYINFEPK
jgi:mannose-6-phosphate isomerase-like protein (cupin superfamily)